MNQAAMKQADIQKQLERAGFDAGLNISTYREESPHTEGHDDLSGTVFRVAAQNGGFELLLTDKATKMYGDGPALMITIDQLKKHIAAGLPVLEDNEYQRLTFVGD